MATNTTLAVLPMSLHLVDSNSVVEDKVIKAIYKEVVTKLNRAAFKSSLHRQTKNILEASLKSQPEYLDMVSPQGRLRAELGVVDSDAAINSVVQTWLNSIQVRITSPRIVANRLLGTVISITAIQADFQDVIQQSYASYTTEKGENIPWLEWLLLRGVEILVMSHVAVQKDGAQSSRTGTNTVMVKTRGAGWGVPAQYAGTQDNNYATRAVVAAMPKISAMFQTEIARRF